MLAGCMNGVPKRTGYNSAGRIVTVQDVPSSKLCDKAVVQGARGSDTKHWTPAPQWAHYVTEAKRRGITCGTDDQVDLTFKRGLSKYSNYEICQRATFEKSDGTKQFLGTSHRLVQEAFRRNLVCGTNSGTDSAKRNPIFAYNSDAYICAMATRKDGTVEFRGSYGTEVRARNLDCRKYQKKPVPSGSAVVRKDEVMPKSQRRTVERDAERQKVVQPQGLTYPSYDPAKVTKYYCANNDGLFGGAFGGNSRCADSIEASCNQEYPKKFGDSLSYANNLTCRIKSGDGEFANIDEWKFGRPYLIKTRAYFVMAIQNLLPFRDAHESAELVDQIFQIEYKRFMTAKRQRGINMMLMGSCFATHGIQNCLSGSGASYQRQTDGFLTSSSISGVNRICSYDEVGSRRTVTVRASQLCPLSLNNARTMPSQPSSGIAILQNSYVSGLNKVCIYRDGVSGLVTTVGATDICPPTQ